MTTRTTVCRRSSGFCAPLPVAGAAFASLILASTLCILHTLPLSPPSSSTRPRFVLADFRSVAAEPQLGRYGQLMLSFIGPDLPFTIFIPTPASFDAMLRQSTDHRSESPGMVSVKSSGFDEGNVHALVSRIFGFSAIPRRILSGMVAMSDEMGFDSVSGFRLNLVRLPPKGSLVVNNIACSAVDMRKGAIVVHLVDGILMDAEFEQSVMPFRDDEDKGI